MDIDNGLLDNLVDVVYKKVRAEIFKELNDMNVEFFAEGVVKAVNGDGTATVETGVYVYDSDSSIDKSLKNVPNLSGQTLTANQKVKIFYNKRNMAGCYIGTAF